MVKIINAFRGQDPIAQTISQLGQSLFGDRLTPAINQEKYAKLARENTETENLMKAISGGGGAQRTAADPITQAFIVGSGYKPSDFAALNLMGAANEFGATDQRTQNAQVGSGQTYRNTAGALDTEMAETRRQFDQKPIGALGPDGRPTFARQGNLDGMQPVLSDAERKGTLAGQKFGAMGDLPAAEQNYLGADSSARTPKNYVTPQGSFITYDGVTDARTGQQLPPGGYIGTVEGGADDVGLTNSTMSGVQQQEIANTKFRRLLGTTRDYARKDPTNFGIPGFVKGTAADLNLLAQGLAQGMGYQGAEQAVLDVQRSAAANGVDPGLLSGIFDPNLSALQTSADLMVYAAAEALAGQSGRSVSDKDVVFFQKILGTPDSWLMNQERFLSKLDTIEQILANNEEVLSSYRQTGQAPAAGAPSPPAAPAPQGEVVDWQNFFGAQ